MSLLLPGKVRTGQEITAEKEKLISGQNPFLPILSSLFGKKVNIREFHKQVMIFKAQKLEVGDSLEIPNKVRWTWHPQAINGIGVSLEHLTRC